MMHANTYPPRSSAPGPIHGPSSERDARDVGLSSLCTSSTKPLLATISRRLMMADSCVATPKEHQLHARLRATERVVAELALQLGVLLGDCHNAAAGDADQVTATRLARWTRESVVPPPPAARPPPDRAVDPAPAHQRAGAYRWGFPRAAEQLRRPNGELTLGGVVATALVCWGHVRGRGCDGGCGRAHVWGGACPKALNAALGSRVGKRCAGRCGRPHPTTPEAKRELDVWWRGANRPGAPKVPEWGALTDTDSHGRPANTALRGGDTATLSSRAVDAERGRDRGRGDGTMTSTSA